MATQWEHIKKLEREKDKKRKEERKEKVGKGTPAEVSSTRTTLTQKDKGDSRRVEVKTTSKTTSNPRAKYKDPEKSTPSKGLYPATERAKKSIADSFRTDTPITQRRGLAGLGLSNSRPSVKDLPDDERKALLRERELAKLESNKGLSGFVNGLTFGLSDMDRKHMMSVLGATKGDYERIDDAKSSGAYAAGDVGGAIVSSLLPYGAATKLVGSSAKVANAGTKIGNVLSKAPKISAQTADTVGKGIAKSIAADIVAGTPIDAAYSMQGATSYDETGEHFDKGAFAKNMAINSALNVGTGVALESVLPGIKRLANRAPAAAANVQPVLVDGKVRYVSKGSLADVTDTPRVDVTDTPRVDVTDTPRADVTDTPRVGVTDTPRVGVTDTPRADVTDTPRVDVTDTPRADVTDTPRVDVTDTPRADVADTPRVGVPDTQRVDAPLSAEQGVAESVIRDTNSSAVTEKVGTRDLGADVNRYGYKSRESKVRSNTIENSPMFDNVREELSHDNFTYDVVSERESLDKARQRLEVDFDGEVDDLSRKADFSGEDLDTAMGIAEVYVKEAEESGDYSKLLNWVKLVQEKGTQAGQLIQAFSKYSRNTVEGKIVSAQQSVRRAQDAIKAKNPKLASRVERQAGEISDDLERAVMETISGVTEETSREVADLLSNTRILPRQNTTKQPSITDRYRASTVRSIKKRLEALGIKSAKDSPALKELYDDISNTIGGWIKKGSSAPADRESALDGLRRSIQNRQANPDEFEFVFREALDDARKQFADDNKILEMIDELEEIGITGFNPSQVAKSIDEVLSELEISLSKICKSSNKSKAEILNQVRSIIVLRTGASEKVAESLVGEINKKFREIVSDRTNSLLIQNILRGHRANLKSAYERYAGRVNLSSGLTTRDTGGVNLSSVLIARDTEVIRQAIKDCGIDVQDLIKKGEVDRTKAKTELLYAIERKLKSFDVEESLLGDIRKQISESFDKLLRDKADAYLRNRFRAVTRPERKEIPLIEDILGLINAGAYSNSDIVDIMRAKNNIPVLKAEDVRKIQEYMELSIKAEKAGDNRMSDIWRAKAEDIVSSYNVKTSKDKVTALLRIAMLGNLKTLVTRNFGGNVLLAAAENVADVPASLIDRIVSVKTGRRTITAPSASKLSAQVKGFGKGVKEWGQDIKYGVDTSPARAKFEIAPGNTFKGDSAVSKALRTAENFIFKALQLGDRPFYQAAYEARLAELKKIGITGDEAKLQAHLAGLDRTYQNDGKLAETITRVRRTIDDAFDLPLGSFALPFAQTPANIASKMLDYSPVGFISAVKHLGTTAGKGTFDQRLFSQRLGRAFTGTGLFVLGMALAKNDILVPDIYDRENFDLYKAKQFSGRVPYSIKIGDTYYGFGSLQPVSAILAMGAEAYEAGVNEEDVLEVLSASGKAGLNTFFSQSFLQSIFDLMSGDSPTDGLKKFALSVPTQGIPSLMKQIANVTDEYERETYDKNPFVEIGNKYIAAVPGLRQRLLPERRDVTGAKVKTNQGKGIASKILEQMIAPDSIKTEVSDAVNNEAMSLFESTGKETVLLGTAPKTLRYGEGEQLKLTGKQYTQMQKTMGEYAYSNIAEVIKTKEYRDMPTEDKAKLIGEINNTAYDFAKAELLIQAGKSDKSAYIDNLNKTYRDAYANVSGMSEKKYAEVLAQLEVDCQLAGDYDAAIKVFSLVNSGADPSMFKALDGDKKSSGRYYQDMVEPAQRLINAGYTAKDIVNIMNEANTNGDSYINSDEATSYLRKTNLDTQTKRDIYRLLYNTRSYSRKKGTYKYTSIPF